MTSVFVAFEDRLVRVGDRGRDWSASTVLTESTLGDATIWDVAVHPDHPARVFCATFERGLLRSDDGGDSWHRCDDGAFESAAVTAVALDPADSAVVYAGTEPSRIYRSTDGGVSWAHRDGLIDLPSASQWSYPPRPTTHHVRWIEVDPLDPETLYVSVEAGALVRSFDAGATWVDRVSSGKRDVHSLATHPESPGHVWAAAGDGYAESTDGGDSWEAREEGLDARYCWSVALDPADPETVLLSAARGPRTAHRSARAESFVFRKQTGDAWERIDDDLPTGDGVLRYVLASGRSGGALFAATNVGIFRTTDAGDSWTGVDVDWPAALERQPVNGMAVVP